MSKSRNKLKLSPIQILVLGYLLIVIAGALLLSLPLSSTKGASQPFIDSIFIATSGISTSGLSIVDIGRYYSLFGQIVLMLLFQIGGIGYMTFVIFIAHISGMGLPFKTNIIAKESLATDSLHMLGKFFRNVIILTLFFEGIGAVILAIFWMNEFPPLYAIYLGIFHSISAFCTAGFSTFSSSLMNYKSSSIMNLTIDILSLVGGIGFFVLIDIYNCYYRRFKGIFPNRLALHSKIVLFVTSIVIVIGGLVIFISERWPENNSFYDKLIISFFQSISASTTDGFNSVDIGAMSAASLTILMVLMFIGASPGSTGGGMKTTTLAVLFIAIESYFRGKERINVFYRELPFETVTKSFVLFSLFIVITVIDAIILANTESASYIQVLFEIVSALGNTGLSTGITPELSFIGKLALAITMFIGRVGPLMIAAFIIKKKHHPFRYATEDIFVG